MVVPRHWWGWHSQIHSSTADIQDFSIVSWVSSVSKALRVPMISRICQLYHRYQVYQMHQECHWYQWFVNCIIGIKYTRSIKSNKDIKLTTSFKCTECTNSYKDDKPICNFLCFLVEEITFVIISNCILSNFILWLDYL